MDLYFARQTKTTEDVMTTNTKPLNVGGFVLDIQTDGGASSKATTYLLAVAHPDFVDSGCSRQSFSPPRQLIKYPSL
jgi:hypothetical protein